MSTDTPDNSGTIPGSAPYRVRTDDTPIFISWRDFAARLFPPGLFPPITRRQRRDIAVYKAARRRCRLIANRTPHYLATSLPTKCRENHQLK
jgi:hypothetical protein